MMGLVEGNREGDAGKCEQKTIGSGTGNSYASGPCCGLFDVETLRSTGETQAKRQKRRTVKGWTVAVLLVTCASLGLIAAGIVFVAASTDDERGRRIDEYNRAVANWVDGTESNAYSKWKDGAFYATYNVTCPGSRLGMYPQYTAAEKSLTLTRLRGGPPSPVDKIESPDSGDPYSQWVFYLSTDDVTLDASSFLPFLECEFRADVYHARGGLYEPVGSLGPAELAPSTSLSIEELGCGTSASFDVSTCSDACTARDGTFYEETDTCYVPRRLLSACVCLDDRPPLEPVRYQEGAVRADDGQGCFWDAPAGGFSEAERREPEEVAGVRETRAAGDRVNLRVRSCKDPYLHYIAITRGGESFGDATDDEFAMGIGLLVPGALCFVLSCLLVAALLRCWCALRPRDGASGARDHRGKDKDAVQWPGYAPQAAPSGATYSFYSETLHSVPHSQTGDKTNPQAKKGPDTAPLLAQAAKKAADIVDVGSAERDAAQWSWLSREVDDPAAADANASDRAATAPPTKPVGATVDDIEMTKMRPQDTMGAQDMATLGDQHANDDIAADALGMCIAAQSPPPSPAPHQRVDRGSEEKGALPDGGAMRKTDGADEDVVFEYGQTMLHCLQDGEEKTLDALLTGGESIDAKDVMGNTPLGCACLMGQPAIARLLMFRSADINIRNAAGETPLHLACRSPAGADAGLVRSLMKAGLEAGDPDLQGHTPLALAKKHASAQVIQVVEKFADIHERRADRLAGTTPSPARSRMTGSSLSRPVSASPEHPHPPLPANPVTEDAMHSRHGREESPPPLWEQTRPSRCLPPLEMQRSVSDDAPPLWEQTRPSRPVPAAATDRPSDFSDAPGGAGWPSTSADDPADVAGAATPAGDTSAAAAGPLSAATPVGLTDSPPLWERRKPAQMSPSSAGSGYPPSASYASSTSLRGHLPKPPSTRRSARALFGPAKGEGGTCADPAATSPSAQSHGTQEHADPPTPFFGSPTSDHAVLVEKEVVPAVVAPSSIPHLGPSARRSKDFSGSGPTSPTSPNPRPGGPSRRQSKEQPAHVAASPASPGSEDWEFGRHSRLRAAAHARRSRDEHEAHAEGAKGRTSAAGSVPPAGGTTAAKGGGGVTKAATGVTKAATAAARAGGGAGGTSYEFGANTRARAEAKRKAAEAAKAAETSKAQAEVRSPKSAAVSPDEIGAHTRARAEAKRKAAEAAKAAQERAAAGREEQRARPAWQEPTAQDTAAPHRHLRPNAGRTTHSTPTSKGPTPSASPHGKPGSAQGGRTPPSTPPSKIRKQSSIPLSPTAVSKQGASTSSKSPGTAVSEATSSFARAPSSIRRSRELVADGPDEARARTRRKTSDGVAQDGGAADGELDHPQLPNSPNHPNHPNHPSSAHVQQGHRRSADSVVSVQKAPGWPKYNVPVLHSSHGE